jgi:hypothetical protein
MDDRGHDGGRHGTTPGLGEVPTATEAATRRLETADAVRMRCPVCELPAEWAGHKFRCRRCGWLSS